MADSTLNFLQGGSVCSSTGKDLLLGCIGAKSFFIFAMPSFYHKSEGYKVYPIRLVANQ